MVLNQYNCSPSSLECSPDAKDVELEQNLDDSFEKGTQSTHAQNIWHASVEHFNSSLELSEENEKGFNDNEVYRSFSIFEPTHAPLCDLIKSNKLFRAKEKKDFIEDLEKETELCGLLVELMLLFNHNVFN
jgi:hypothetical protein